MHRVENSSRQSSEQSTQERQSVQAAIPSTPNFQGIPCIYTFTIYIYIDQKEGTLFSKITIPLTILNLELPLPSKPSTSISPDDHPLFPPPPIKNVVIMSIKS